MFGESGAEGFFVVEGLRMIEERKELFEVGRERESAVGIGVWDDVGFGCDERVGNLEVGGDEGV